MNGNVLAQATFLLCGMGVAGGVHVLWLRSPLSAHFAQPVDGGLRFRGRRLFGDHKQVRGFMVLPLASAAAFALLALLRPGLPHGFSAGLWNLTMAEYAGLGFLCGLAFMVAELPNSFLKRQLGVAPGSKAQRRWLRPLLLATDRLDSVLGVLLVLSLLVPVSVATWCLLLATGPLLHAVFSTLLYRSGVKERAL